MIAALFSERAVTAVALVALVSLVPIVWAMVDVLRRPRWQFSPMRKTAWVTLLAVGWLVLWPAALVVSVIYLSSLRHRLRTPGPPPGTHGAGGTAGAGWPSSGPSSAGWTGTGTPASSFPPASPAPPLPPEASLPPPGWYPDPAGGAAWRWWDGVGWTEHVHPADPN